MKLGVTETKSVIGEGSEGRVQDCSTCEAVRRCVNKFYDKARERGTTAKRGQSSSLQCD